MHKKSIYLSFSHKFYLFHFLPKEILSLPHLKTWLFLTKLTLFLINSLIFYQKRVHFAKWKWSLYFCWIFLQILSYQSKYRFLYINFYNNTFGISLNFLWNLLCFLFQKWPIFYFRKCRSTNFHFPLKPIKIWH